MRVLWLALSICLLFSSVARAALIDKQLQEAEDYLVIDPSRSYELLQNIKEPTSWTTYQFIRWHLIAMRSAVPTDRQDILISSLEAIFEHHQHAYFREKLTSITSGLGIWLRKNHYTTDALTSFECSYKYAINDRQRLTLTNSLALLARQLDKLDQAKVLYRKAHGMAVQSERINILAMIENNMGLIALEEGDLVSSEKHVRSALTHFQNIDKRVGQISAGINLLFIFLTQDQLVNFERLYQPTENLTQSFTNRSKRAQLTWLRYVFLLKQGGTLNPAMKKQLHTAFTMISDERMQRLFKHHFADPFFITVPKVNSPDIRQFKRPWFRLVSECAWK